jgi:hypothetical protein
MYAADIQHADSALYQLLSAAAPGDVQRVELPSAGLTVNVAAIWWQKSFASDTRVAIEPKIAVPLSSTAFFRGKDPVLATAIAYRAG